MSQGRRNFLKLLSLSPLVASACSAEGVKTPTIGETPPNTLAPRSDSYAAQADRSRLQGSGEYGAGLPTHPQCPLTGSDVLGPFHRQGAPKRTIIATHSEPGRRLAVSGRVLRHDCKTPVSGAILDIWHADAKGRYDNVSADYRLRAQVVTDTRGHYAFETILPGHYPLGESMRPAHIHFNVSYPGCQPLTTQLYFEGDPYLRPKDPCGVCNSGDKTLIIALTQSESRGGPVSSGVFDIHLAKK